jgi:hypothetical protein
MTTKAQLIPGTKFKIHNGNSIIKDRIFEMGDGYVSEGSLFGKQMNIDKMGNRMMKLYSFNMLGVKSEVVIRFEEIEIIAE